MSKVPFLASKVMDVDSGNPFFQRDRINEVNGQKIGIFSLLSPEVFSGLSDPRKKGWVIRDPFKMVQEMVKELGPQTDLILLLSHPGYPKDVNLTQKISGIHLMVGGAVYLSCPTVFKDTIVLQTSSKGMYTARLHLTLLNHKAPFYNIKTKRSLEDHL